MERGGEEREAKSAIVKSQPHPKPTRSVQTLLTVQIPCGEDDPPAFRGLTRESAGVGVGRPDLVKRKYHCTYCRCSALPQPMGIRRNANPSGGCTVLHILIAGCMIVTEWHVIVLADTLLFFCLQTTEHANKPKTMYLLSPAANKYTHCSNLHHRFVSLPLTFDSSSSPAVPGASCFIPMTICLKTWWCAL